jgi:hypothetical protein
MRVRTLDQVKVSVKERARVNILIYVFDQVKVSARVRENARALRDTTFDQVKVSARVRENLSMRDIEVTNVEVLISVSE